MCNPASFIVTKNRILWSRTSNSHEVIIRENKLNDRTSSPDFVRIEISPKDGDLKNPMKNWIFKVDQDFRPEWFDSREAEIAARLELKKWCKSFIINRKSEKPVKISEGEKYVFSGNIIVSGGEVRFYGNSTGKVSGGRAWFYDNSTGKVSGGIAWFYHDSSGEISGGDAWFRENSTGKVFGGEVDFYDKSTGKVSGGIADFYNKSTGKVTGGFVEFYENSTGKVSGGDVGFFDDSKRLN